MTIQDFIDAYPQLPSAEEQLLKDAVAYWESTHSGQTVTISVTPITVGASYYHAGPPNMGINISSESGGRFPVESVLGRPAFAQYDNMVGVVHEMGHAILALLGVGTILTDSNETDELNNAVLAWAAIGANGDMV